MTKKFIHFLWIIASTILALAIGYGVYMVVTVNASSVVTATVEYVSVDDGVSARGTFIRDEELLFQQKGIYYQPLALNGKRVSAGANVAAMFSSQKDLDTYNQLAELDERIADLEQLSASESESASLPKVNKSILSSIRSLSKQSGQGSFSSLSETKSSLELSLLTRANLLGEMSLEEELSSLKLSRHSISSSMSGTVMYLQAPKSGYFSSVPDGYEQIYTVSSIDGLTPESFAKMQAFPAATVEGLVVGKMIYGYDWYAVFTLSAADAAQFSKGDKLTLAFSNSRVSVEVAALTPSEDGKSVLLVLQGDAPLTDTELARTASCTLVTATYSGFKVPAEAIRASTDDNGDTVTGVYVLEGAQSVFKEVEILFRDGNYYILRADLTSKNNLFLNDEVILTKKDLEDGKIVK